MKIQKSLLYELLEDITDDLYLFSEFFNKYLRIFGKSACFNEQMKFINLTTELILKTDLISLYLNYKEDKLTLDSSFQEFESFDSFLFRCDLSQQEIKEQILIFLKTFNS